MENSSTPRKPARGQPRPKRVDPGKISSSPGKKNSPQRPLGRNTTKQYQVKKVASTQNYSDKQFKTVLKQSRIVKTDKAKVKLDLWLVFLIIAVTLIASVTIPVSIKSYLNPNIDLGATFKDIYSVLFLSILIPAIVIIAGIIKRYEKD